MTPLARLLLFRWSVAWRQLSVLTLKELRQLVRDRPLILFVCYIFTVNILLAGESGSRELSRAALIVHDADRTAESRELISRFQAQRHHGYLKRICSISTRNYMPYPKVCG